MAIQIDLETSNFGIPFAGAYFRIAQASVLRQREIAFTVMIDVVGYATVPNDETREVDFRRYHTPLPEIEAQEGVEFLAKCYQWVMSQEDMLGSIAV
jgi:membrane-bound lytic murein transglycosylase